MSKDDQSIQKSKDLSASLDDFINELNPKIPETPAPSSDVESTKVHSQTSMEQPEKQPLTPQSKEHLNTEKDHISPKDIDNPEFHSATTQAIKNPLTAHNMIPTSSPQTSTTLIPHTPSVPVNHESSVAPSTPVSSTPHLLTAPEKQSLFPASIWSLGFMFLLGALAAGIFFRLTEPQPFPSTTTASPTPTLTSPTKPTVAPIVVPHVIPETNKTTTSIVNNPTTITKTVENPEIDDPEIDELEIDDPEVDDPEIEETKPTRIRKPTTRSKTLIDPFDTATTNAKKARSTRVKTPKRARKKRSKRKSSRSKALIDPFQ